MSDIIRRNSKSTPRLIEEKNTVNKHVTLCIEELDSEYCIYLNSYGERIDYIYYNSDLDLIKKIVNFMIDTYNEGHKDGRNGAIMFMN